jgi:hypothetical protein
MSEQDKTNFVLVPSKINSTEVQKYYFFSSISDLFNNDLKNQIDINNKKAEIMNLNNCPDP